MIRMMVGRMNQPTASDVVSFVTFVTFVSFVVGSFVGSFVCWFVRLFAQLSLFFRSCFVLTLLPPCPVVVVVVLIERYMPSLSSLSCR